MKYKTIKKEDIEKLSKVFQILIQVRIDTSNLFFMHHDNIEKIKKDIKEELFFEFDKINNIYEIFTDEKMRLIDTDEFIDIIRNMEFITM